MTRFTSLQDFLDRAGRHLDPIRGPSALAEVGDLDFISAPMRARICPAAVLIPIIPRPGGPTALLTQRPDTMAAHPGQVAFPGGKMDACDADSVATALREAEEEVGIEADRVDLVACGAPYITGSAFRITPVIGLLPADFTARPDPREVAATFEAPLDYLLDSANHKSATGVWQGQSRTYYEMPWQGYRIWGVTAGIIRDLYNTLYDQIMTQEIV